MLRVVTETAMDEPDRAAPLPPDQRPAPAPESSLYILERKVGQVLRFRMDGSTDANRRNEAIMEVYKLFDEPGYTPELFDNKGRLHALEHAVNLLIH